MWLNKFNLTVSCMYVCLCVRACKLQKEKKNCSKILYIDQINKELQNSFLSRHFCSLSIERSFDNATIKVNDLYSLYFSHTFPFTLPTIIYFTLNSALFSAFRILFAYNNKMLSSEKKKEILEAKYQYQSWYEYMISRG